MPTISYVSGASAEATTLSMPSHQYGDLICMFAFNNSAATAPTVPTGWIIVNQGTANSKGRAFAFKNAVSAAETSGTWTNASLLGCVVYRDSANWLHCGQVSTSSNTVMSFVQYNTLTAIRGATQSWVLGAGGVNLNTQSVETPPAGMTNRVTCAGASSGEIAIHDTNAAVASWPSTNVTLGSSVTSMAITVEIADTGVSKTVAFPASRIFTGM